MLAFPANSFLKKCLSHGKQQLSFWLGYRSLCEVCIAFSPGFLLMCMLGGRGCSSVTWVPGIHLGELNFIPGTWLWPGPAPSVMGIWRVNKQKISQCFSHGSLYFAFASVPVSLSFMLNKIFKYSTALKKNRAWITILQN